MSCLSFCSHLIPGGIRLVTEPLGPVTTTLSGLISTFTLSGIGIGFFPIRDICVLDLFYLAPGPTAGPPTPLINVAEQFAAVALLACLFPRHDTMRGRQDIDTQAAQHSRNLGLRNIHAASRPADPLDFRDDLFAFRPVLEKKR